MKIAFIGDCQGKVHYNRYKSMSKYISNIVFDFFTIKNPNLSKKCAKYDKVYYASYTMYNRNAVKHPYLYGSATSWKCITGVDHKKDMKILPVFRSMSANNVLLATELQKIRPDIKYIPNGVDTSFFIYERKEIHDPLTIGWVGNYDRSEKNYPIVARLVKTCPEFTWSTVITSKSTPVSKMLSREKMREFYYALDYLLVASSYEGTPNPALEAAACGIPLITTRVGNMPEIINEGKTGFFVYPKKKSIRDCLDNILGVSNQYYIQMCRSISETMIQWDWSIICKKFEDFFINDTFTN